MGHKNKLKKYHKKNRIEKVENIHSKFGNDIVKSIKNGYTSYDLVDEYNISYKYVIHYCKYYGLKNKLDENAKQKLKNTAIKNGKKSSKVLKGKYIKPLTEDIVKWYKDVVSDGWYKMEVMNGLKSKFGYGRKKYKQLVELYGEPNHNNQEGKENPMYGVTPSKKSGIGIKSWIYINGCKYYCRSLLELRIFIYLFESKIRFEPSRHRIKYKYKNKDKTYLPDIVLLDSNTICEIKPSYAVSFSENVKKFNYANEYCNDFNLEFKIITENTYDIDNNIDFNKINSYIDNNMIEISKTEYKRLKNNID